MTLLNQFAKLTMTAALAVVLIPAQDQKPRSEAGDPHQNAMTGCLSKDSDGQFKLTDDKTGKQVALMAKAGVDMEKHANHTVKVHGMAKDSGAGAFEVTKIDHVAATCTAASK